MANKSALSREDYLSQMRALDEQMTALRNEYRKSQASDKMPKVPLSAIIQQHLMLHGGSMKLEQLVTDLASKGHDLGKYPKRTVKVCLVGPYNAHLFEVKDTRDGEKVRLLRAKEITYKSQQPQRQQISGSHARVN